VVDNDWAQQIDIYPTILDMIGYDKPLEAGQFFDKNSSPLQSIQQEQFIICEGQLHLYLMVKKMYLVL
jgi:hypothetical protein